MGCFGCFRCPDILPNWDISDFEIRVYDSEFNIPINGEIESDSLYLFTMFETEYVQNFEMIRFSLLNSAYGWSCDESGREGINDHISEVKFSSNADFNGFKKGDALNAIIRTTEGETIEEWIANQEIWKNYIDTQSFVIFEKPMNIEQHEFTIVIKFDSGRELQSRSESVKWI